MHGRRQRLADGRMRAGAVPRALRPALLPATLADLYLARLARAGCDPFDPHVQQPAPGRAWRLLLASLAGRV